MEDKLKREAKEYVQKLFKKEDKRGSAAIHRNDMKKIVKNVIPDFAELEELDLLLEQHVKVTKYTEHNKKTNQFDVKYQEDTLDFPSVLAIVVHFLKKEEKKNGNTYFSDRSMVRGKDFPATNDKLYFKQDNEIKKRLF